MVNSYKACETFKKMRSTRCNSDWWFWTITPSDPAIMVPREPGTINGGLFKRSTGDKHPMIIIDVPDVDKHARQVKQAGGKVVMPKIKVGDSGYYARVIDTDGNVVGIWQTI